MTPPAGIAGERTVAQVQLARPAAARLQRALAAGLLLLVGVAVLCWYYLTLAAQQRAAAATAATAARGAAASEMKLPPIAQPRSARRALPVVRPAAAMAPSPEPATAAPSRTGTRAGGAVGSVAPVAQVHAGTPVLWGPAHGDTRAASSGGDRQAEASPPPLTQPAEAELVPSRRWLLPRGSFLDCTLETAIDSTLAGLTTCVLATDAYGADGRVVLLERGTRLVGESRSDVRAGQARVAVQWTEARTPTGVVVALAAPGTDGLGRAGIPGSVDRHSGERFGAAVLLSMIDGAVNAVALRQQGAGAVVYNAQGTRDVATEVLRSTVSIPPTIRVAPGARVMVTVVRDVDFTRVYRLVVHDER